MGLTYISSIRWDASSRWDWDLVFVGGGGYFRWGLTFSGGGSDPLPNYVVSVVPSSVHVPMKGTGLVPNT